MLTEKEKRDGLDELVAMGGGLAPVKRPLIVEYDFLAMNEYRRKNNKTDLTEDERKMFLYDEPLVYA